MDITATKIWASPSTLHLRLLVRFKTHSAVQFADLHIPLELLPQELRGAIDLTDEWRAEAQHSEPLF
jgi:hypothetical protein